MSKNPTPAQDAALHSLPLLHLDAGRQAMLTYFENTWALTEMLFSALTSTEAYYIRPYHKTRHPLIFYYTHPVCFYVNKLLVGGFIDKPVNPEFELLFETGVDEMTWDDLHDGGQDIWPNLDAVREYRQQVYQLVKKIIKTHPALDQPVTMDSPAWGLVMAFEHERIHLETSSVLIRELPLQYVRTPGNWPATFTPDDHSAIRPVAGQDYPAENPLLEVSACAVDLGKPRDWPSFGWDNEYGSERRLTGVFKASKFLISNGEFHHFVADGGYENPAWWGESGWGWRQFRNVKWPSFWQQDGPAGSHRYRLRTTFAVIDMQWDWPALVNYFEARAYCAWLTARTDAEPPYRLLSEGEHLALREPAGRAVHQWRSGNKELLKLDGVMTAEGLDGVNLNLQFGSECPVNAMPANSLGFHDAMGNVWQWCEDTFHPLPGFEIHPYYTDFSTPCFDGEHQMILGGSFISTGDEASIWARFHFRPHFFQHAGFRVVQGPDIALTTSKYESTELVDQYLLFH
ncbi:MAG: 5-histidylcysteine sulfoxide synthase, partial [Pseudohongiellaceae bacterium]